MRFVARFFGGCLLMLAHVVAFGILMIAGILDFFMNWRVSCQFKQGVQLQLSWYFKEALEVIWDSCWRGLLSLVAIFWFPWQDRLEYPFFGDDNPPTFRYIICGTAKAA